MPSKKAERGLALKTFARRGPVLLRDTTIAKHGANIRPVISALKDVTAIDHHEPESLLSEEDGLATGAARAAPRPIMAKSK